MTSSDIMKVKVRVKRKRVGGIIVFLASTVPVARAFVIPYASSGNHVRNISFFSGAKSLPSVLVKLSSSSPLTFAGKVERGIVERFGSDDAARVIQSWRLLDEGYEHRQYVGTESFSDEQTRASNCHQYAHSYVPGLTAKPFWDPGHFDWCQNLANSYNSIKEEFLRVTQDQDRLQREGNNVWAGALSNDASSYGEGWRTLVLMNRGIWDPLNVKIFPVTATAIRDCGIPATEVFFASMKPSSVIKKHSDFTNFVLTSHLAISIPESGKNKCRLTVGDDTRQWINGEVMVFDTSIMHDAVNESDDIRYILMLRVWHPELTGVERNALQFTFDCLEVPALVSDDPGERFISEHQVNVMRAFPKITTEGNSKRNKRSEKRKQKRPVLKRGGKGFGV